jgi:hypothetical protein
MTRDQINEILELAHSYACQYLCCDACSADVRSPLISYLESLAVPEVK